MPRNSTALLKQNHRRPRQFRCAMNRLGFFASFLLHFSLGCRSKPRQDMFANDAQAKCCLSPEWELSLLSNPTRENKPPLGPPREY